RLTRIVCALWARGDVAHRDQRRTGMTGTGTLMRSLHKRLALALFAAAVVGVLVGTALVGGGGTASGAVLPPGNAVQQWDQIAEDTVVGSGAFQNEGLIYMGYVSSAMYRAVSPGERRGQSPDAAVVEAAYATLSRYFPAHAPTPGAAHAQALPAIRHSHPKAVGLRYAPLAAAKEHAKPGAGGLQ